MTQPLQLPRANANRVSLLFQRRFVKFERYFVCGKLEGVNALCTETEIVIRIYSGIATEAQLFWPVLAFELHFEGNL